MKESRRGIDIIVLTIVLLLTSVFLPLLAGAQEMELEEELGKLEGYLSYQYDIIRNDNIVCYLQYRGEYQAPEPTCRYKSVFVEYTNELIRNNIVPTNSIYAKDLSQQIEFSRYFKGQIREVLIPRLKSEIRDLKTEIEERDTIAQNQNNRDKNLGPQCPDRNPDTSRNKHRFDTNNNPNDRTYIDCNYYPDYNLQTQVPYTNGKFDGVQLNHVIYPKCGGRIRSGRTEWSNGKKVFSWRYSCNLKTGYVYKMIMNAYSNGIKSNSTQWHDNGVKRNYYDYKPNGRPAFSANWNRKGELNFCTKYDEKGNPHNSIKNCQ